MRRALRNLAIADPAERGAAWQYVFAPPETEALLTPGWRCSPPPGLAAYTAAFLRGSTRLQGAELLMYSDQKTKLTDGYCERVDRPTMAVGLEARVPFLDLPVARFAQNLPATLKVRGFRLKHLLRRALRGLVPDHILALPKRGFTIPIPEWLRNGLRPLLRETLDPGCLARRGILHPPTVSALLADFEAGRGAAAEKLWLAFTFELWCREHLDAPTRQPAANVASASP